MQIIPIQPVPSQSVTVVLAGQPCTINIRQTSVGIFTDLYVNNAPIITGVLSLNANVIVRNVYLGFIGDIAFIDTTGSDDPYYTGLGSQFLLAYFSPSELPAGVQ